MWPSLSCRPWRTIAAITLALVLSFSSLSIALAETISAVEGPWTMSTSAVTYNCCGPDVYYGVGQTTSGGCCTSLEIQIRGYNDSTGWHLVDSKACYAYPGSTCTTPETMYNSSDNTPPPTGAYAASDHIIYYPVDANGSWGTRYEYYTSTDGAYSTASCVYTAGC